MEIPFINNKPRRARLEVRPYSYLVEENKGRSSSSLLQAAPLSPQVAEGVTKVRFLYFPYKRLHCVLATRRERQELCNITLGKKKRKKIHFKFMIWT